MVYVRHCIEYCDEQCSRPPGHEGEHYANGMFWREAAPEEVAAMKAERDGRV